MHRRLFLGLLALFLAGQMACVDLNSSSGGNTALYLHAVSASTPKVQVFTNLDTVFTSTTELVPSKTFTSSLFTKAMPLAWGGLVVDPSGNNLYMVGETGTVVRIDRLRNQATGDLSSNDVVFFTLGNSSERLSGGIFGQAAFDSGTLYVTESNTSGDTQIWAVPSPRLIISGATVPLAKVGLVSGDKYGSGLAVAGGYVYGFFNEGDRLNTTDSWTGPRLRKGTSGGFSSGSVIGGSNAQLRRYGTMAFDSGNTLLYFGCHNTASNVSGSPAPILVFSVATFTGNPNTGPDYTLGSGTALPNLRVLTHAGNRDWLAGLGSDSDNASNVFWLWKEPKQKADPVKLTLPGGGIRGLAFDGSN